MKKTIAFIILFPVIIILLAALLRTNQMQNNPLQEVFVKGFAGIAMPNGYYKGKAYVPGEFTKNWQGKNFNAGNFSGINIFNEELIREEKYPFIFKKAKGLKDKNLDVIRIEYNLDKNPLWLHPVVDEIVLIGDEKYLGKVNYQPLPGLVFTLAYFTLEKPAQN